MRPPAPRPEAELLLAQAAWVRSVVRRLVLDEGQAEELVQDTWLAALQGGPGTAGTARAGGLRAWLGAVARNLARRRRRRESLRRAVEREAARRESLEEGHEEVERMQLQRTLADAVLALSEPCRSAVILRHLDGLSAAEIARRQGCTPAAARQRVSRGLTQLRQRLEHRFGERAGGCLALVPLLGPRSPGWGAGMTGGLLMGSKLTLGAAGLVLAALALWMTTSDREPRGVPPAPAVRPPPGTSTETATEARAQVAPLSTPPVAEPATPPPSGRRQEAAGQAPAPARVPLALRVTDSLDRPLPGARLTLDAAETEWISDEQGRVAEQVAPELLEHPQALTVACEGYLTRHLELDLARPGTLVLQALPLLGGQVLDPRGLPVRPPGHVKAQVLDARTSESHSRSVGIEADGSYRIADLPPGRLVSLEARARGFASTELALDLGLEPDSSTQRNITLGSGVVVTGIVLDAQTREPLPGAVVWMGAFDPPGSDSEEPLATADAEGRFRIEGADERIEAQDGRRLAFFWLLARAAGHAASPLHWYGAEWSAEHAYDFEMLLEPSGCSLHLRVLRADGQPAGGATVWAIDGQGNPYFEQADANGVHEFEDLPAGPLALWLAYENHQEWSGTFVLDPLRAALFAGRREARRVDLELAPGEVRSEEVRLAPPGSAGLEGRVVDAEGRGVPDFSVHSQLNFELNGLRLASGSDELRTDDQGRFRFEGLHPGLYQVWTGGEGSATPCAQPRSVEVTVETDRIAQVGDLAVGACLTVEGRVDGGGVEPASLELALLDPRTGERQASTRPAADGSFRFEPVLARRYDLALLRDAQEVDRTTVDPGSSKQIFLRVP